MASKSFSTPKQKVSARRPWWEWLIVWGNRLHMALIILGFIALPVVLMKWMRQPFTGAFVENTLVIAHVRRVRYLPGESGRLRTNDVLTSINSAPLRTAADLNRELSRYKVGDVVTLELRSARGAKIESARVRLRRFTLKERWFYFFLPYFLGIIFVVTGIWTFLLHRRDIVGRAFATFAAAMGFSLAGILDVWGTQTLTPLWLYSVGMTGASLGMLALIFPRKILEAKRSVWIYVVALALVAYTIWQMNNWWNPWAYITARQALLGFAALGALAFIGVLAYWQSRREFPLVRARSRLLLGTFLISFGPVVGWIFSYILFPQTVHFTPLIFAAMPVLPLGLAYSVSSYRVVDVDTAARRFATYTLLWALAVGGYALLVAGASLVAGRYLPPNNPILISTAAFILALVFNPLYKRLASVVDLVFAKSRRTYSEHLEEYSRQLVGLTDQSEVLALTRTTIKNALKVETLHIFLYNDLLGRYVPTLDENGEPTAGITFTADSPFIKFLQSQAQGQAFFFSPEDVPPQIRREKERLQLLKSVLFVPLFSGQKLLGFIALGEREGLYGSSEMEFLDNLSRQFALAVDRFSTVSKLRQRVEQLNALTRLAQGANITVEFDDLLELLYAQTQRLIPAYHFQIILLEGNTLKRVFVVAGDERRHNEEGKTVARDEGLAWDVVEKRKAILVSDYTVACRIAEKIVDLPDATAWMGVPLAAGADILGVMVFAENTLGAVYSEEQANWAQSVADLAGGVIAKARLLEEIRKHAAQLSALNQISNRLSSTLSFTELMNQIAISASSLLSSKSAALFLVDEMSGDLSLEVAVGEHGEDVIGYRVSPGDDPLWQAVNNRRAVVLAGNQKYPEWVEILDKHTPPTERSLLLIPMIAQDKTLGVIAAISRRDGSHFTDEDVQLGMAFAAQAAVALENARLYSMTDKALTDKVEELSALQRIDRELNATLDLNRAMQVTLEWAIRRTNSSAGLIGLLENEEQMRVLASYGYSKELANFKDGLIPVEEMPLLRKALQTRQPVIINAGEAEEEVLCLREGARAVLAIPIEREGKITALLVLESTKEGAYRQDSLHFLTRLADHASIAIANAQLYAEVQKANQTKSEFISFVAHELKTPMTSIRGYTDLLAKGVVGELNENQANFLNTIRKNVERMRRLVEDLLEISRLEAGRLELNLERVDLRSVVEELIETFSNQIKEKNQTLTTDIPEDLPPLWADRMRLSQILTNLISNAHKYTPEGGRIEVIAREALNEWDPNGPKHVVHIMVRDNGLGMSEEDQRKVFQKFFRSEDARAREAPGTGLGLHLTKYLVEMHGGRIWFESKLNEGTTFHFTIPVAED